MPTWSARHLKVGKRVWCEGATIKLGTIVWKEFAGEDIIIHIDRDDGVRGGGHEGAWTARAHLVHLLPEKEDRLSQVARKC